MYTSCAYTWLHARFHLLLVAQAHLQRLGLASASLRGRPNSDVAAVAAAAAAGAAWALRCCPGLAAGPALSSPAWPSGPCAKVEGESGMPDLLRCHRPVLQQALAEVGGPSWCFVAHPSLHARVRSPLHAALEVLARQRLAARCGGLVLLQAREVLVGHLVCGRGWQGWVLSRLMVPVHCPRRCRPHAVCWCWGRLRRPAVLRGCARDR